MITCLTFRWKDLSKDFEEMLWKIKITSPKKRHGKLVFQNLCEHPPWAEKSHGTKSTPQQHVTSHLELKKSLFKRCDVQQISIWFIGCNSTSHFVLGPRSPKELQCFQTPAIFRNVLFFFFFFSIL